MTNSGQFVSLATIGCCHMKYMKERRLYISCRIYDGELTRYEVTEEYAISDETARNYMRQYRDANKLSPRRRMQSSCSFVPKRMFISSSGFVRHPSSHDQFLDSRVQFFSQGCANAPPFAMPISLDLCGFAAHTRLTIGRGVHR